MAKKKFILVSLQEEKAKKLAQVISNETCRKILDFLAEKEATESELAEKLDIPISTVHYNLDHLIKSGLVTVEHFHYSEKGKEVNHYKLANEYIIIAPKSTHGLKERLRSILPVSIIALAGAGFIEIYNRFLSKGAALKSASFSAANDAARSYGYGAGSGMLEKAAAEEAAPMMAKAPEIVQSEPNLALWFLAGSIFVIIVLVIVEMIKIRRERRKER